MPYSLEPLPSPHFPPHIIHMHVCMYIYVYVHMCVCINIKTCIYACTQMYMYAHVFIYRYSWSLLYIQCWSYFFLVFQSWLLSFWRVLLFIAEWVGSSDYVMLVLPNQLVFGCVITKILLLIREVILPFCTGPRGKCEELVYQRLMLVY